MAVREILRKPFVATAMADSVDLAGRHFVVTGCSPGSLGYATVRQLARWGARVVITTRHDTEQALALLAADLGGYGIEGSVDGHPMDLASALSVNTFTQWYERTHGERLDGLINNAGIHLDLLSEWKEAKLSDDGIEIQWRTNYLGTVQLTHNLLPLLQRTGRDVGEARVVNVVSQLHSRGSNELLFQTDRRYESWQAYGLSKLGLIHFTSELHRRFFRSHNLKSYSLHPGGSSGVYTNVAGKGLQGHAVIGLLRKVAAPLERLMMASADEGAQTQLYCATSPAATSGHYYRDCQIAKTSADCLDEKAALRLWHETEAWLGRAMSDNGAV